MWFIAAAVLCGCSRPSDENLGLTSRGGSTQVDVQKLTQPPELARALGQPGAGFDAQLGARHVEASGTLKLEPPGKPAEQLDESYRLDSDGKGALHLMHESSRGSGFEAVVTGGELTVRPRGGRFVRHKPEGDEVDRLRATVEGVAADYVKLLERWLQVHEVGHSQVAGRAARKLKLSAAPQPAPAPKETDPGKRWRDTIAVRFVDGELDVDEATGAPLAVRLDAAYSFQRDNGNGEKSSPFAVTLSYKSAMTTTPEAIVAPADAVIAPRRSRPMLDLKELLEGLK